MKLFCDDSIICLCCNTRRKPVDISISSDEIGICKRCYNKLSFVSSCSPFEGTSDIDFLITPLYYNNTIRKLILRYKFHSNTKLCEIFSKLVCQYLLECEILNQFDFITSVPLSRKRFLKRGYNQSELLARKMSEDLEVPYLQCIYRCKDTKAQSKLKYFQRIENIKNAFIADDEKVKDKSILLLDDIHTTGSTLNSCAMELKNKGAKRVVGITLANTTK